MRNTKDSKEAKRDKANLYRERRLDKDYDSFFFDHILHAVFKACECRFLLYRMSIVISTTVKVVVMIIMVPKM